MQPSSMPGCVEIYSQQVAPPRSHYVWFFCKATAAAAEALMEQRHQRKKASASKATESPGTMDRVPCAMSGDNIALAQRACQEMDSV